MAKVLVNHQLTVFNVPRPGKKKRKKRREKTEKKRFLPRGPERNGKKRFFVIEYKYRLQTRRYRNQ